MRIAALLLRRLIYAVVVMVVITFVTYFLLRWLRPEQYPRQLLWSGTRHDMDRALLHFDFGHACSIAGCPPIADAWRAGYGADLILLGGAVLFAVVAGVGGGIWCLMHDRTRRARALEGIATVAYCVPAPVLALGVLLLFNPTFGVIGLPWFFDANPEHFFSGGPLDFIRAWTLPWVIVGAQFAGRLLRVTVAVAREEYDKDYLRTAIAKGLRPRTIARRHAAPAAYVADATITWASVPWLVTNMVLVEWTMSVPGFLLHFKHAAGQTEPALTVGALPTLDIPMLQAQALWVGALILGVSLLVDVVGVAAQRR